MFQGNLYTRLAKLQMVLLVLLVFGISILAQKAYGEFSTEASAITAVSWQGKTLIERDGINYLDEGFIAGEVRVDTTDGRQIINVTGNRPELQYRKELGISKDCVELNVQMNLPAYCNDPAKPDIAYSFYVPLDMLTGTNWHAITGRTKRPKEVSGQLTAQTPNGSLAGSSARWIAFESDGRNIVFDLNPKGVSGYHDFGPGDVLGLWNITKTDTHLQFSFGRHAREPGGVFSGKVVIFQGRHEDYMTRHIHKSYHYFQDLPTQHRFSFGTAKPAKEFITADTAGYDEAVGYGWKSSDQLEVVTGNSQSVAQNAVVSAKDNSFLCELAQPGLYVVTVRASNPRGDFGPFSLLSNGVVKAEDIIVKKDRIKTITYTQWLDKGIFKLGFKGDWTVSVIAMQMLLHKEEDFAFNRGFWLVDDVYEPTPVNSNATYKKPINYKVAVSEIEIPEKVVEPAKMPHMEREVTLPNQQAPELRWRYNAFVSGLGTPNRGTFLEYNTTEKITRRLKDVKESGSNTVLMSGLLARHVHREHLPRVQKTIKEIVRIGHELGMHMLDHQDLTLLWNKQSGTRVMVEEIDFCQLTIDGGLVTRGRCLSNPDFRRVYFAWMKQFMEDTDIDGIMIDEVVFHGKNYCGCEHCRRQFTKDTGLILPVDENSDILYNHNSILWKTWTQWRTEATVDWWAALRKQIQITRPNFCFMNYSSEGAFQKKGAAIANGGDLSQLARTHDFTGTEIMSRNIMDNCRYVFTSRKSYNMLREAYGCPVHGLVYSLNSAHFAYFGWAMNNMHAQATWAGQKQQSKDKAIQAIKYINWADNVDKFSALPVSDIAVVFSVSSRDWTQRFGHHDDVYGIAQILADNHIQHTILSEPCLTVSKLNDYRLVILPSVCCISDDEISQVRQYIAQGGRVLITGHSGIFDEIGLARSQWAFADIFGAEISSDFTSFRGGVILQASNSGPTVDFPSTVMKLAVTKPEQIKTFLNVVDKEGAVIAPVGISSSFGRGEAFYCAPRLGAMNYQKSVHLGRPWTFELNIPVADMLMNVIQRALGDGPLMFEAVDMPENVFTTVYQQNYGGKQSHVVHLLNATGVTMKVGDTVPREKSAPAFPALTHDMIFEIELPSLGQYYAVSPDYSGKKEIYTEKLSSTRYKVTVPKENLECYTILYFHEN